MEQSYKEKYEQAIEKLRNFCRDYDTVSCLIDVKEELANLFPELAESEDEKVRKELIFYLGDMPEDTELRNGVTNRDVLVWLERQGEHANFRDKIQVGDKVTRNENGVLVNLSQLKRMAKPREKQGEKLPAGFYYVNSEGKKFYSDTFKYGDVILHVEKQGEQKSQRTISAEAKEALFDYENANMKQKDFAPNDEQKPAEQQMYWTEEEIEPIISDYLCGREHYGGMIGRLCHLKPKQKQTEWGEDDKAFLDDILCKLEHDLILNKDEKDWLKSLRPQNHWKPSELQLGCLSDAIEHYNSFGYPASKLKELLDDLKKLKGEV